MTGLPKSGSRSSPDALPRSNQKEAQAPIEANIRNVMAPAPVVKGTHIFERAMPRSKEGGGDAKQVGNAIRKRKREDDDFGSAFSFLGVNGSKVSFTKLMALSHGTMA